MGPSRPKKHDGFDRTADITSRVKMSQEMAKAINDGLFNYEDELWDPSDEEAWKKLSKLSEESINLDQSNLGDVSLTPSKLRRGSESRRGKEAARFYAVTKEPGHHGEDKKKRKT